MDKVSVLIHTSDLASTLGSNVCNVLLQITVFQEQLKEVSTPGQVTYSKLCYLMVSLYEVWFYLGLQTAAREQTMCIQTSSKVDHFVGMSPSRVENGLPSPWHSPTMCVSAFCWFSPGALLIMAVVPNLLNLSPIPLLMLFI